MYQHNTAEPYWIKQLKTEKCIFKLDMVMAVNIYTDIQPRRSLSYCNGSENDDGGCSRYSVFLLYDYICIHNDHT